MDHIIVTNQNVFGTLWAIGWLFAIGYLRLSFWKGVLGLFVWPFYIGRHFSNKH